jgi:23S rRNA pseudouridine2604 synthase
MKPRRLRVIVSEQCGVSLSAAAAIIRNGRVKVNGAAATPTRLVTEGETVTVDGAEIPTRIELAYVLFNKPRGIECTMNEDIADNLLSVFRYRLRLFPVGRLDKESEGLLLMINDGDLYHEIAHADSQKEKEYYVEVHKPVTEEFLQAMRSGVKILNVITDPCEVFPVAGNDRAFRIILRQGMNRQIRRMSYNLGFSVHKLVRTRIMHLHLDGLKPGEWRELSIAELQPLLQLKENG